MTDEQFEMLTNWVARTYPPEWRIGAHFPGNQRLFRNKDRLTITGNVGITAPGKGKGIRRQSILVDFDKMRIGSNDLRI